MINFTFVECVFLSGKVYDAGYVGKKKFNPAVLSVVIVLLISGATLVFISQNRSDQTQPATDRSDSQPANQSDEPDHQLQPETSEETVTQSDPLAETTSSPGELELENTQDPADDQDTDNPLPYNWDELTPAQKTERNPYDCDLQTHYVWGDNDQCLSVCYSDP